MTAVSITSHKERTCPDVSRRWKMEMVARCDSLDDATKLSFTTRLRNIHLVELFCDKHHGNGAVFFTLLKSYLNYRSASFQTVINLMQLVSLFY